MGWLRLVESGRPEGPYGVAIAGYPGVANVGAGVVSYLSEELGSKLLARVYSEYLFLPGNVAGISVSESGGFELPSVQISETEREIEGLGRMLLISSQVQPVPWGQLEVASEVIKYVTSLGVERLIVITGYADPELIGKVLTFGSDKDMLERFLKCGAVGQTPMRSIVGLAGATLAAAKLRGMNFVSVTGVSETSAPDFRAAGAVLKVLNGALGLGLSLEGIERRIREFEEIKQTILRQLQEQISSFSLSGSEEAGGYVG